MTRNTDPARAAKVRRQAKERFVFKWKESGIEVTAFIGDTPDEVWRFAIENLRPTSMTEEEAEPMLREYGEVIVCET